jgi:hypothetical protein
MHLPRGIVLPAEATQIDGRTDLRLVSGLDDTEPKHTTTVPTSVLWSISDRFTAGKLRLPPAIDWLLIAAVNFLFAKHILDLDSNLLLGGGESQANTGIIAIAQVAIRDHGGFPFWNPFLNTGVPYLSDPMTHVLNPLASVPGIVLGPVNGPKVAVFLTILVSGLGFYYLAGVMGIWRPVRIWAALAYSLNGHMIARFGTGHFDFGLAFAFLPLAVAFTVQTVRRPDGIYPFLGGLSIALVFFSGNVHYTVYLIPALALAVLLYLFEVRNQRPWLSLNSHTVMRLAAMALWTLGIVAAQLIPYWQVQGYMFKHSDRLLEGSQPVVGSLLDFVRSDVQFYSSSSYGKIPGFLNEYYSYVGWAPYVGVILLPLALIRGRRRDVLFGVALFAFYIAWASAAHTPFRRLMDAVPWLYKLRWTSRALGPATLPLILLAALGFDALRSPFGFRLGGAQSRRLVILAAAPVVLLAGVFLALALQDEYQANQGLVYLVQRSSADWDIARALEGMSNTAAFVGMESGTGGLPLTFYEEKLQRLNAPWAWDLIIHVPQGGDALPGKGAFIPRPHFLVLLPDTTPVEGDAQFVENAGGRKIYRLPRSLPLSFTTRLIDPPFGPEPAWESKASEAAAHIRSTNRIDVEAEPSPGEDTLVLLQTYFPGWEAKVDGSKPQTVSNLGGYLSTPALPGRHTYEFAFDPAPQRYGLAISAGTILGAVLLYTFARRRQLMAALRRPTTGVRAIGRIRSLLRHPP